MGDDSAPREAIEETAKAAGKATDFVQRSCSRDQLGGFRRLRLPGRLTRLGSRRIRNLDAITRETDRLLMSAR